MQLSTWGHITVFTYEGSVRDGTDIEYGQGGSIVGQSGHRITVTANQYRDLLKTFKGKKISVGTAREPAPDTLGGWLITNVGPTAVASYVAPILVHEHYAQRVDGDDTLIKII
jgi:hypothetical protein